jgi:dTDP-4-amino-4,6-dideoxygalactose transaminase
MPIVKSSPSELAIHGGGPPAFASKIPVFNPNVGHGQRFAGLAERMFMAHETPGELVEEFEGAMAAWLDVRNVVGFSSLHSAAQCLMQCHGSSGKVFAPAFGSAWIGAEHDLHLIECEATTFGMSPRDLSSQLNEDARAVFACHVLGRPCLIEAIDDLCDEWGVPLLLYGHQALGSSYDGAKLGSFGRTEVFDLGRDQLVHAMDAAVVTTDDDLIAHRLQNLRAQRIEGINPTMSDAAAAMGIANLEAAETFIELNEKRYRTYLGCLANVPGIKLVRHEKGSNYQAIAIEIDPGLAGLTRNSLYDVLVAENVGVAKPLEGQVAMTTPIAAKLSSSLLQLPSGPSATDEAIEAIAKLVELAIVRSLESPDPIRLAA